MLSIFFSHISALSNKIVSTPGANLWSTSFTSPISLKIKPKEIVIAEAKSIMLLPSTFNKQQACLVNMGFNKTEAKEILDIIANLPTEINETHYLRIKNIVKEMFYRLNIYERIVEVGEEINPNFLLDVDRYLKNETLEAVRQELVFIKEYLTEKSLQKMETSFSARKDILKNQKQIDLEIGLIAYYPFTDGSVSDFSGNGYRTTIVGHAFPTTDLQGKVNQAMFFDGNGAYLVGDSTGFPTYDRAVSLWFYWDTTLSANHPVPFAYGGNGACGHSFFMALNPSGSPYYHVASHCGLNALYVSNDELPSPSNQWHHWVVISDGSGTRMFIDAQLVGSNKEIFTTTVENRHFAIGCPVSTNGLPYTDVNIGYFGGKIDEVRIYNRALSNVEVESLFLMYQPSSSMSLSPSNTPSNSMSLPNTDSATISLSSSIAISFSNSACISSTSRPSASIKSAIEFQVSNDIDNNQEFSAVASLNDGGFLVVWASVSLNGIGPRSLYGQRYNFVGVPVNGKFLIDDYLGDQYWPSVTGLSNGDFVIVWESYGQDGSEWGVYGQQYTASGFLKRGTFRVNTHIMGTQYQPVVRSFSSEGFIVAWESYGQDGNRWSLFGQLYNNDGSTVDGEFKIHTAESVRTDGDQYQLDVSTFFSGQFIVVWASHASNFEKINIYGRLYDHQAVPLDDTFQINTYLNADHYQPKVIALSTGGFFVTWWSSNDLYNRYSTIRGRQYDQHGNPLTNEFKINTYTDNSQSYPRVSAFMDGNFILVWQTVGKDGSGYGIYGQPYNIAGFPEGSPFQVNTYTSGDQMYPVVAVLTDGRYVVAWQSNRHTGHGHEIYGRLYSGLPSVTASILSSPFTSPSTNISPSKILSASQSVSVKQSFSHSGDATSHLASCDIVCTTAIISALSVGVSVGAAITGCYFQFGRKNKPLAIEDGTRLELSEVVQQHGL